RRIGTSEGRAAGAMILRPALRGRFRSLRLRMLLLILVASAPLIAMAVGLAVHNSRLALDASIQRIALRRQAVLSRVEAVVEATGGILAALLPADRAGPGCPSVLQRIVA